MLRTGFVVVRDVIDPCAYGIAPHLARIIGLQKSAHFGYILHSGVKPNVVSVMIENHGHAVMDG